jgi:hypothetical protein
MCVVFLLVLLAEITYSYSAFLLTYDFSDGGKLATSSKAASIGYKIVEIICVNFLNCLIVTVGKHYWDAVRVYQMGRSVNRIDRNLCINYFYKESVRKVFILTYVAAGVCVFASALLLIFGHGEDGNSDYTGENVINFVVTLFSIVIFLFARLECYYVIENNQEISRKQLRKEFFYTSLVLLTCALRITSYWLAILDVDPSHTLRSTSSPDCYDDQPWHATYIIGLTIFVNLLPAIIFIDIFKATANPSKPTHEALKTTLTEAEYSS